mgnify:CR=1 FL=1
MEKNSSAHVSEKPAAAQNTEKLLSEGGTKEGHALFPQSDKDIEIPKTEDQL